jgi:hypothetical protein
MKSVIEIIKHNARGRTGHPLDILSDYYIRVDKPAECYMRLVVEHIGTGPRGLDCISVAHYYEQNGDQVSDPEMTFEVVREVWDKPEYWGPVTFQMGGMGIYKQGVGLEGGKVRCDPHEVRDQMSFMKTWNKNLKAQGFILKFADQRDAEIGRR